MKYIPQLNALVGKTIHNNCVQKSEFIHIKVQQHYVLVPVPTEHQTELNCFHNIFKKKYFYLLKLTSQSSPYSSLQKQVMNHALKEKKKEKQKLTKKS